MIKHGLTGSPEWSAFKDARHRCKYKTNPRWKDYGGRGIKFLFDNFQEFIDDIGRRPRRGYSLDRKNNNGHYEPGNVRWATTKQQGMNRRRVLNLIGERFGRLTVLDIVKGPRGRGYHTYWHCLCVCGNTTDVQTTNLQSGTTRSCGCLRRDMMRSKNNPRRLWLNK